MIRLLNSYARLTILRENTVSYLVPPSGSPLVVPFTGPPYSSEPQRTLDEVCNTSSESLHTLDDVFGTPSKYLHSAHGPHPHTDVLLAQHIVDVSDPRLAHGFAALSLWFACNRPW